MPWLALSEAGRGVTYIVHVMHTCLKEMVIKFPWKLLNSVSQLKGVPDIMYMQVHRNETHLNII